MDLKNIHNVYFIGIGGIGMSALALYFNSIKKNVAGYDKTKTNITKNLEALNVKVNYTENSTNIPKEFTNKKNTLVVYTPAIPKSHQQLNYFINHNFNLLKRSQVLGQITKNTICLAVAGTHGKTTTSAILGHILKESNVKATSFLGGIAENYQSNLILGGNKYTVVEADEFDKSFLQLYPNIACITSVDADHLDIYGNAKELKKSFHEFADKVTNTLFVKKGLPIKGVTFGVEENADFNAQDIKIENGSYTFNLKTPTHFYTHIKINLPGKHNLLNTIVAIAMANSIGIEIENIKKALLNFKGIKRRFSYKIKTNNLILIDDYAHHPTEIKAVENAIREMHPNKKVLAVFQPHLFSRTKDFADDFASALSKFDEILLLDIYPARELPIKGVTSQWLLSKIKNKKKKLTTKEKLVENIKKSTAPVIVILGAGDIGQLVKPIKNNLLLEN